jgi:hypothetical protein
MSLKGSCADYRDLSRSLTLPPSDVGLVAGATLAELAPLADRVGRLKVRVRVA